MRKKYRVIYFMLTITLLRAEGTKGLRYIIKYKINNATSGKKEWKKHQFSKKTVIQYRMQFQTLILKQWYNYWSYNCCFVTWITLPAEKSLSHPINRDGLPGFPSQPPPAAHPRLNRTIRLPSEKICTPTNSPHSKLSDTHFPQKKTLKENTPPLFFQWVNVESWAMRCWLYLSISSSEGVSHATATRFTPSNPCQTSPLERYGNTCHISSTVVFK